jgi:hypothetical protein
MPRAAPPPLPFPLPVNLTSFQSLPCPRPHPLWPPHGHSKPSQQCTTPSYPPLPPNWRDRSRHPVCMWVSLALDPLPLPHPHTPAHFTQVRGLESFYQQQLARLAEEVAIARREAEVALSDLRRVTGERDTLLQVRDVLPHLPQFLPHEKGVPLDRLSPIIGSAP